MFFQPSLINATRNPRMLNSPYATTKAQKRVAMWRPRQGSTLAGGAYHS